MSKVKVSMGRKREGVGGGGGGGGGKRGGGGGGGLVVLTHCVFGGK